MTVRQAMQARLDGRGINEDSAVNVRLPTSLRADAGGARLSFMRRLAASRTFAIGDKAGVLRAAQRRSGRAFRLDVRQRVTVKGLVSRHAGSGAARGVVLAKHLSYLGRSGAGLAGEHPSFFDRSGEGLDPADSTGSWSADRHHFRFIVSPEHGDRISDLREYTREVMHRVSADLGERDLEWIGACHFDTDQPHAHIVVRGRRSDGRDLVIPRDYMGYGFRARAQEVAHERLGDLSRQDAERRIWRETQADRFTGFDRRLLHTADADRMVDDGFGDSGAWSALTRGRLRHLEVLGLATRLGHRYRLDAEMETRLRGLQLRQDIIRTLHHRRLESGRAVSEIGAARLRGHVVRTGAHDELGGVTWVIVRAPAGDETYARLAFGQPRPPLGRAVEIVPGERGAHVLNLGRGADLGR